MTQCCKCSRVLSDGASFCPFCGSDQNKDTTPDNTTGHSSQRPTKRGKRTDAMERRQDIGRANTIVAAHASNESALGHANTMSQSLSSEKPAREPPSSSERPTIVRRHVPSDDSSGTEASQGSSVMVDTAPEWVGVEKIPPRSTQDIQGRSISVSPQRESVVVHSLSDPMTAPSILNDSDATDHSGSGNYMSNLANSTQAIEMTQEMLDAMDQHAAQIQRSKEPLSHVDTESEKAGPIEVLPEILTQHKDEMVVVAPSITEPSEAEETPFPKSGSRIDRNIAEVEVAPMPQRRTLSSNSPPVVRPSRVETPFDQVFEYVLANKHWTIPVGIVVLVLALFLAETLR